MNRPSDKTIEIIAPSRDVEELTISDGYSIRNVAHAEQRQTFRLPRGGPHDATLVAAKKFYDGSAGGEAGHYAMVFVEFRADGSRWRTAGVKVRAVEAARIAKGMLKSARSAPSKVESPRLGGKAMVNDQSTLIGLPVLDPKGYLLFVRHQMRGDKWGRTRGVEVTPGEVGALAQFLTSLKDHMMAK
jgi:hypothetical protein